MKLDRAAMDVVLGWLGASDPGVDPAFLQDLEARIGQRLPEDTRALLRSGLVLEHPDAEGHPEIDGLPFAGGLPDVDAFLAALEHPLLGSFLSVVHFVGAVPVGVQVQYGDFIYALARLQTWDGAHGGILYFHEREVGHWGATVAAFLHQALVKFREEVDGQLDDLDEDERAAFEPDLDEVRDCFVLRGCDPLAPTPAVQPPDVTEAWERAWRRDMELAPARAWIPAFLAGRFDGWTIRTLPTAEHWQAEQGRVGKSYADTMYWLLAHALLGNAAELEQARLAASEHPSTHIQAVLQALPALSMRFEAHRQALYAAATKAG